MSLKLLDKTPKKLLKLHFAILLRHPVDAVLEHKIYTQQIERETTQAKVIKLQAVLDWSGLLE